MSGRAVQALRDKVAASANDSYYLDVMDTMQVHSDLFSDYSGSDYESAFFLKKQ